MSLTIREVEQLAKLARLELTTEEKERFSQELSSILQYVDKLQELKIKADENLTLVEKSIVTLPLREDRVVGIASAEQVNLVKQAPMSEDNLIKTKPVF